MEISEHIACYHLKIANQKSIQDKIDNTFEEASKLLKDDKEKIFNELSKLIKVADGKQNTLKNSLKYLKTKMKL